MFYSGTTIDVAAGGVEAAVVAGVAVAEDREVGDREIGAEIGQMTVAVDSVVAAADEMAAGTVAEEAGGASGAGEAVGMTSAAATLRTNNQAATYVRSAGETSR